MEDEGPAIRLTTSTVRGLTSTDSENSRNPLAKELETLRGNMAEMLHQNSRVGAEYVLDNAITALQEKRSHVTVPFSDSPRLDFDMVIEADGLGSKIRQVKFGENFGDLESRHVGGAVFSTPRLEPVQEATKGHTVSLKPQKSRGVTGAYLIICTEDNARVIRLWKEEQVAEMERLFSGLA